MNKKILALVTAAAVVLTVSGSSMASAYGGKGGARAEGKIGMGNDRAAVGAVITSTLGISLDTLKERMRAGESLATIAGSKKDALITALAAQINNQIDAAVSAGKISTTQASAMKAKTSERVTKMVNKVKGAGHRDKAGAAKA